MIWYAALQLASPTLEQREAVQTICLPLSPRMASTTTASTWTLTLDLGRLRGAQVLQQATALQDLVYQTIEVVPAIGMAVAIRIAQLAAHVTPPESVAIIAPHQEQAFLAPLPIAVLVDDPTLLTRLHTFSLTTIGAVARLSLVARQSQFGNAGKRLYQLVHLVHQEHAEHLPLVHSPPHITIGWRFQGSVVHRRRWNRHFARLRCGSANGLSRMV